MWKELQDTMLGEKVQYFSICSVIEDTKQYCMLTYKCIQIIWKYIHLSYDRILQGHQGVVAKEDVSLNM